MITNKVVLPVSEVVSPVCMWIFSQSKHQIRIWQTLKIRLDKVISPVSVLVS